LPNSTPNTLHPKNTVFSAEYWIVLGTFSLGLTGMYGWAFRLHVTLELIGMRLDRRARAILQKRTPTAPVVVEARR
jgi:hypothetical protein